MHISFTLIDRLGKDLRIPPLLMCSLLWEKQVSVENSTQLNWAVLQRNTHISHIHQLQVTVLHVTSGVTTCLRFQRTLFPPLPNHSPAVNLPMPPPWMSRSLQGRGSYSLVTVFMFLANMVGVKLLLFLSSYYLIFNVSLRKFFYLIFPVSPLVFIAWFYTVQRSLRIHYGRTGSISYKLAAGSKSLIRFLLYPFGSMFSQQKAHSVLLFIVFVKAADNQHIKCLDPLFHWGQQNGDILLLPFH